MSFSSILLIAYAATPLVCGLLNARLLRRRIHWAPLFLLAFIAGYVILMVTVQVKEIELERDLDRYDLDGNGSFNQEEMTAEAELAMDALTSDTGRTFAPFTGIPITFIWTSLNFIFIPGIAWTFRFKQNRASDFQPAPENHDA